MQKVITVRASQSDLDNTLNDFTKKGWKVMSVTKGSEWGRIGFSYKWTIVLEIPDNNADAAAVEQTLSDTKSNLSAGSYGKTILLAVGLTLGVIVLIAIMCSILI